MLLPMETWSAAWLWLACWKMDSTVRPCSATRCSSQVMGKERAAALALHSAGEFRDEGDGQRGILADHFGQYQYDVGWGFGGRFQHAVNPEGGAFAIDAAFGDADSDAAEVFQQRQSQHDGDGP